MFIFPDLSAAIDWWNHNAVRHACSVLVDFRDIGKGIQKRSFVCRGAQRTWICEIVSVKEI